MYVKDLIKLLKEMPENAIVCVEAWAEPEAKVVKCYNVKGQDYCYIGDDLEEVEYWMEENM